MWLRASMLMYNQPTSESTQPGGSQCSGDVSWHWQHSVIGHASEEEELIVTQQLQ